MDFLYEKTYDMNRVVNSAGEVDSDGYEGTDVPVTDIVTILSYYLHSQVELRQMEDLVNTYTEGMKSKADQEVMEASKKQFTTSMQRVRHNHDWVVRFYEPINNWLQNHIYYQIRL